MRGSLVILFDESHVLTEGNPARVVSVNLIKVPLHHLLSNGNVQGLKGVFH